jgi:DNA-binding response OmpR family regulator
MSSPKGRILCTEDDADTRDLVRFVLTDAGYEIVCTSDAEKAVHLAQNQHFDLYLLDNWMPVMSGRGLTHQLRTFDSTTPILFYSGAGFESDKEDALAAGAQGYLVKPVLNDDLIAEVEKLIAESGSSP